MGWRPPPITQVANAQSLPIGDLNEAVYQADGNLYLKGWSALLSYPGSLGVRFRIGSNIVAGPIADSRGNYWLADTNRNDVAAAFGVPAAKGFELLLSGTQIPASGVANVCVEALTYNTWTVVACRSTSFVPSTAVAAAAATYTSNPGRAIGLLATRNSNGTYSGFCSASVINTSSGRIALTAGHCAWDNGQYLPGLTSTTYFAPGYNSNGGSPPYGWFRVETAIIAAGYATGRLEEDVAFLRLYPRASDGLTVQQAVGALGYVSSPTIPGSNPGSATQTGYGNGVAPRLTCSNSTVAIWTYWEPDVWPFGWQTARQLMSSCAALPGGVSGGPWYQSTSQVYGLNSWGDDWVNYSPYLSQTMINSMNQINY